MIPEAAVEAAAKILYAREWFSSWEVEDDSVHDSYGRKVRDLLEAAAPHILAAKVAEAKSNNDHIVEGGDGHSAGFHYALHCIEGEVK